MRGGGVKDRHLYEKLIATREAMNPPTPVNATEMNVNKIPRPTEERGAMGGRFSCRLTYWVWQGWFNWVRTHKHTRENGGHRYPQSQPAFHSLHLFFTHIHLQKHTIRARLADGRPVKGGQRGPDVTEPTVQKAKGLWSTIPQRNYSRRGEDADWSFKGGGGKKRELSRVSKCVCVCVAK